MKTLEAINQILLLAGERQVRDISSPPSLKAKLCLVDAIQEFSLLGQWPALTTWAFPTSWVGTEAHLPDNTIKVLAARTKDGSRVNKWIFREEHINNWRDNTFTLVAHNRVEVQQPDTRLEFKITLLPLLPTSNDLDIDIDPFYLNAILKRALSMFVLVHFEDASRASQHTAEYELMLTQLRSRAKQSRNGSSNIYRNGRE
jgi:hypothetical protein